MKLRVGTFNLYQFVEPPYACYTRKGKYNQRQWLEKTLWIKKQIDQIQSVMSTIRHLDGGKDVRIILFKGFQYLRSIPPFVRESQATIISSIDDNNIEAYTELLGKRSLPNLLYETIETVKYIYSQMSHNVYIKVTVFRT